MGNAVSVPAFYFVIQKFVFVCVGKTQIRAVSRRNKIRVGEAADICSQRDESGEIGQGFIIVVTAEIDFCFEMRQWYIDIGESEMGCYQCDKEDHEFVFVFF